MTKTLKANFDKLIVVKDERGDIAALVHHEVEKQRKQFYKIEVMDMEEICELLNVGEVQVYEPKAE